MTFVLMSDAGPVDEAFLDGYGFGDRLLEGVMFRIIVVQGELVCPDVHPDSQSYVSDFNEHQVADWRQEAADNCRVLGDNLQTRDGDDAWIELVEAPQGDPLAGVNKVQNTG